MVYRFVKGVPAPSNRIAVLARLTETSPWVQVESLYGEDLDFIDDLENDEDKRKEYIAQMGTEDNTDWGEDGVPLE